jgi:hypothetical protein
VRALLLVRVLTDVVRLFALDAEAAAVGHAITRRLAFDVAGLKRADQWAGTVAVQLAALRDSGTDLPLIRGLAAGCDGQETEGSESEETALLWKHSGTLSGVLGNHKNAIHEKGAPLRWRDRRLGRWIALG